MRPERSLCHEVENVLSTLESCMCGHCTERAALAERLSAKMARGVVRTDSLLLPVHLQEADDWRLALKTDATEDDPIIAIVSLCRAWSERLTGVAPSPLRDALGPARHVGLQRWLDSLALPLPWTWLRDLEAEPLAILPLEVARDELDAYLTGWLHVGEGNTPAWDDATLHERLPRISAALDVLHRDAPDDDRLVVLALSSPGAASPFSAVDLWLQRRAVGAVIAHRGFAFVLTLLERWRSGTLLAAVLRDEVDPDGLQVLRDALAQRPDDGTEGTRDLRTAVDFATAM